jgi:hypothetical protein
MKTQLSKDKIAKGIRPERRLLQRTGLANYSQRAAGMTLLAVPTKTPNLTTRSARNTCKQWKITRRRILRHISA